MNETRDVSDRLLCSHRTLTLLVERVPGGRTPVHESVAPILVDLARPTRTLKIEAHGDSWLGRIKPKIRLIDHWLDRAGFKPGDRVSVTCLAPGVIELRCVDAQAANDVW